MTDYLERKGWEMAYDDTGGSGPAIVFCHALGADRTMWDAQVEAVVSERRAIRYDHRGHGESGTPAGAYTMADLGEDVLALADHLGVDRFDFCGISMGGLIGQWLALNRPDRVGKLALANTGAKVGTEEGWNQRIAAVRDGGMDGIADAVVERFLSEPWREAHPRDTERAAETLRAIDPEGYIGCCEAVKGADFREDVSSIEARTLLVAGQHDVSVPPESLEMLGEAIPDSEVVVLDAAHLSNVEQPAEFTAALGRLLST